VSELVTHGAGEPKIEKSTRDSLVKLAGAAPPSSTLFKANGRICALTALTILSASASVGATKRGASARKFAPLTVRPAFRAASIKRSRRSPPSGNAPPARLCPSLPTFSTVAGLAAPIQIGSDDCTGRGGYTVDSFRTLVHRPSWVNRGWADLARSAVSQPMAPDIQRLSGGWDQIGSRDIHAGSASFRYSDPDDGPNRVPVNDPNPVTDYRLSSYLLTGLNVRQRWF
jgi:hypothetical protein